MRSGVGAERSRRGPRLVGGPAAMKDIARGRIAALRLGVGAAADADQGLADDVVEEEGAGVDRVAAEDRAEARAARSRSRGVFVEGGGDQLGAAQRGHARDRVGEGGVEGVGAVGEGVHRAGPQLGLGLARSSPRVGDYEHRADERPDPLLSAGRQTVDAGHLGSRHRRRDRRDCGARHRGDRLGGVDRAAAAKRDKVGRTR